MIPAKKSLGQNFLVSQGIIDKIITAADLGPASSVLEVGPGKGALTAKLLEHAGRVVAVEKDDRLVPFLTEKFGSNPKFTLIHQDILEFVPKHVGFGAGNYVVVANLPYYITGVYLQRLCESDSPPARAILMLQKEVSDRILRRDGKESILSIAIAAYGKASLVTHAPAGAFSPSPSVDSSVIKISPISKAFFTKEGISETHFFEILKKGFAHKRKLLRGNLGLSEGTLSSIGIPEKARAEELPLEKWALLAKKITS